MKRKSKQLTDQICFRLDRGTNQKIKQLSEKTNQKPSVIIRELIEKSLQQANHASV